MRRPILATIFVLGMCSAGDAGAGDDSFNVSGDWDVRVSCKGQESGNVLKAKFTGTLFLLQPISGQTSVRIQGTSPDGPLDLIACGATVESAKKPSQGNTVLGASEANAFLGGDLRSKLHAPGSDGTSGKIKGRVTLADADTSSYLACKLKGKRTSTMPSQAPPVECVEPE